MIFVKVQVAKLCALRLVQKVEARVLQLNSVLNKLGVVDLWLVQIYLDRHQNLSYLVDRFHDRLDLLQIDVVVSHKHDEEVFGEKFLDFFARCTFDG